MALQIRRGTNAERLTVAPAEGELIYTTDSKRVYVGDGSTFGGTDISAGIESLLEDSSPQLGGNLDLNGHNIIGNGNININGTIIATGDINLGDAGSDSVGIFGSLTTSLVPSADSNKDIGSAALRWRNGYFTSLVVDGQVNAVAINANIIADDSTVVFDSTTGTIAAEKLVGTFTGDTIGNVTGNVTGDITGSLYSNLTLMVDGPNQEFYGLLNGNVIGDVVGNVSGNLTGNVTGNLTGSITATGTLDGDLTGSVFADDSTPLLDAINRELFLSQISMPTSDTLTVNSALLGRTVVKVEAVNDASILNLVKTSAADISGSGAANGRIVFSRDDINGPQDTSIIVGGNSYIALGVDATGTFTNPANSVFWNGSSLGIGTFTPASTLDVSGPMKPGVYANAAARDAAITSPVAGMIVFVTDGDGAANPQFHGYTGAAWVSLN